MIGQLYSCTFVILLLIYLVLFSKKVQSHQRKIVFLLIFLLSSFLTFSKQLSAPQVLYVSSQTQLTGVDSTQISVISLREDSSFIQKKAIIYLSLDVLFSAPPEVMDQVSLRYTDKEKSGESSRRRNLNAIVSLSASKNCKIAYYEPLPYSRFPLARIPHTVSKGLFRVNTRSMHLPFFLKTEPALLLHFLDSKIQKKSFAHRSVVFFQSELAQAAHTTRPPPFV